MSRNHRKLSPDFPHHITARSNNRDRFPIPLQDMWHLISDYLYLLHCGFNIKIHSFVLMPNHFHLIARDPNMSLPHAMEYFMRETSREIGRLSGRINKIWGGPYSSSLIVDPLYFLHAYKYVYRNPVEPKLANSVLTYPYSSLTTLTGQTRGIIPLEPDETFFSDPEGTIAWLDEPYKNEDQVSIKNALRKKKFKFRLDPKTKRPLDLEEWSSIPATLRPTRSIKSHGSTLSSTLPVFEDSEK